LASNSYKLNPAVAYAKHPSFTQPLQAPISQKFDQPKIIGTIFGNTPIATIFNQSRTDYISPLKPPIMQSNKKNDLLEAALAEAINAMNQGDDGEDILLDLLAKVEEAGGLEEVLANVKDLDIMSLWQHNNNQDDPLA
jgi:hypothetical protein